MSERTRDVLCSLTNLEGCTQYQAVKTISHKHNLATSTVKYVLKKLKQAQLINYNGLLSITASGRLLISALKHETEVIE